MMRAHPCCWSGLIGRACQHYPRPVAPMPFPDVTYNWRAVTVPIAIPIEPRPSDIAPLIAAKMDAAAQSVADYLTRDLWGPIPPWYRVAWERIRDAALVLAGRRVAITHEQDMARLRPLDGDDWDD